MPEYVIVLSDIIIKLDISINLNFRSNKNTYWPFSRRDQQAILGRRPTKQSRSIGVGDLQDRAVVLEGSTQDM